MNTPSPASGFRLPSLPDWAFFPLALALIGSMIYVALNMGDRVTLTADDILEQGVVHEGAGLQGLTTGNGLSVVYLSDESGEFARITAERGPFDGIQSAGAFFSLTEPQREALRGHRVRITATLRAAPVNGAEGVQLNLFLPDRGQNNWQRVVLSEDAETYSIEITSRACSWDLAFLALWPDWDAQANTVDLYRYEIQALEPVECRSR